MNLSAVYKASLSLFDPYPCFAIPNSKVEYVDYLLQGVCAYSMVKIMNVNHRAPMLTVKTY